MPTWVALFRGINVGGRNILQMKDLVRILQSLDLYNVRTYIQSGNVVFQSSGRSTKKNAVALCGLISNSIQTGCGFRPHVLVLSVDELDAAIEGNPFPVTEEESRTLHLFFLATPPSEPDLKRMDEARSESESFELKGSVLYLLAPEGIGRSKLASGAEKWLGVPTTARNWRTVRKLWDLAGTR